MSTDDSMATLRRLFGERGDVLQQAAVPLFSENSKRTPGVVGTGFIVARERQIFLVSAAHVLDEVRNGQKLFFYLSNNTVANVQGAAYMSSLPQSGDREGDRIDVGVVRLDLRIKERLKLRRTISYSYLQGGVSRKESMVYMATGFPASRTKPRFPSKDLCPQPLIYWNFGAPVGQLSGTEYSDTDHIAIAFDQNLATTPDGRTGRPPDFRGKSGCPLWLLADAGKDPFVGKEPVVGVVIEKDPQNKLLVATDIKYAIELIDILYEKGES